MKFIKIINCCALFSTLAASAAAQGDIRKVDFKNFTYEPACTDFEGTENRKKIKIADGEFSEEKEVEGYTDRFYFGIYDDIAYGDVDGDGAAEAVVLTTCNTGGTGNFTEGFVFTMRDGKPAVFDRIAGGDRAHGGLRTAKISKGFLIIESNDEATAQGACCAEYAVTDTYKWTGKQFAVAAVQTKRALFPARRVAFETGASSAKITLTIPNYEQQRFVVGARAGQTLTVTVTPAKTFSAELFKGEADATDLANGFRARLKENGDFVFRVQNGGEQAAEVTLTIEIK